MRGLAASSTAERSQIDRATPRRNGPSPCQRSRLSMWRFGRLYRCKVAGRTSDTTLRPSADADKSRSYGDHDQASTPDCVSANGFDGFILVAVYGYLALSVLVSIYAVTWSILRPPSQHTNHTADAGIGGARAHRLSAAISTAHRDRPMAHSASAWDKQRCGRIRSEAARIDLNAAPKQLLSDCLSRWGAPR